MPSFKSLIAASSLVSAAFADRYDYNLPEVESSASPSPSLSCIGTSTVVVTVHPSHVPSRNTSSSAYGDYGYGYDDLPVTYVTEVVETRVSTCTAGQTVTRAGSPYVLPTPSVSTVTITKTVTVAQGHGGKHGQGRPAKPTSGGSGPAGPGAASPGNYATSPVNNSPWRNGGHYPDLTDLIGNGNCYPPGLNSPALDPKNPNKSSYNDGWHYGHGHTIYSAPPAPTYPASRTPSHPHVRPSGPTRSSSGSAKPSSYSHSYGASSQSSSYTSSASSYSSTSSPASSSASSPTSSATSTASSSVASSASSSASSSFTSSASSSVTSSASSSVTLSASSSVTSSVASSSSSSSAAPSNTACAFWMENVEHQGRASFNPDSSYQVFRNVKDFGARGDGVTDDTAAINAAISSGNRCAPGSCASSTTTPATVYFPPGTYIVSAPIIDYYYTQIIGNPNCLPVIKASSGFTARWVIDGNQYQSSGNLGFGSTNVFFRQIANFIIDTTAVPAGVSVAGIHWPTAQATSLQNIGFRLSSASGTQHEGVFIESGSGGLVADLSFEGGLNGLTVGNQQFTMRNLTFNGAVNAINQLWDWGWTYKGLSINNCQIGVNMAGSNNGALSVGSVVIIDSNFFNTPVGISTGRGDNPPNPPAANSLILENVNFINVPTAIQGPGGSVVLAGGSSVHVDAWGQGNSYTSSGAQGTFQGSFAPNTRPASLVSGQDYYERSKPQYEMVGAPGFFSIKDLGARGDGVTDDSDAIMNIFNTAVNSGSIVYWDAGTYLVTKTIRVPPGIKIFGEAYPVILSSGPFFADASNPRPVLQIGRPGETGSVEISNLIVSGKGAQAGAIFIEYNLNSVRGSGLWDVHTRVGGFAGSDLLVAQCAKAPGDDRIKPECIAGFMSMHITPSATGVYMENNWLWVADHDIEDPALSQITIYAGRGLLVQSTFGGNWLYGTAVEHHQLYEYNLASTRDIVMGQIQTETAYWQPTPNGPYAVDPTWNDPLVNNVGAGWGLNIKNSRVLVYGAGLYSFFDNYDVTCSNQGNTSKCQSQIFNVEGTSQVSVYNLNTVGSGSMIAIGGVSIANWDSNRISGANPVEWIDNQNGFVSTIALFKNTGGTAP